MPTGYTAGVADGKVTTLQEFALICARAFGATIMQRDDDLNVPPMIPKKNDYHDKRLIEAERELRELLNKTNEEISEMNAETHAKNVKLYEQRKKIDADERQRYVDMIAQVKTWQPPTKNHVGLAEFMVKQLEDSMSFDCSDSFDPAPTPVSDAEFKMDLIESITNTIIYCTKQRAEENKRYEDRKKWIVSLYESLGLEAPVEEV